MIRSNIVGQGIDEIIFVWLCFLFEKYYFFSNSRTNRTLLCFHIFCYQSVFLWVTITETRLFKYIENFTSKNGKFSDKNSDISHISAQNIDCGYSLEPPR